MSHEFDRTVEETRAFLDSRPVPDLRSAVMERIVELEPADAQPHSGLIRSVITLLWAPRQISVRPAFALAASAAVVALVVVFASAREPEAQPEISVLSTASRTFVQFRLETHASRVQLAGTFTNWEPRYELRESVPGVWTITVPMTNGVHDYAFVVDGQQWVPDPHAPQIGDGFGGINSRLSLLPPDPSAL